VKSVLQVSGREFLREGRPTRLWGLRVACAAMVEHWMEEFIASLPIYKEHGLNAFYLSYQGSDGGHVPCFTADGTAFSNETVPVSGQTAVGSASGLAIHNRVLKLIRAARRHQMAVAVTPFSRWQTGFAGGEDEWLAAAQQAVRLVARALAAADAPVLLDLTGDLGARLGPGAVSALVAAAAEGDPDGRLLRSASVEVPGVQVLTASGPTTAEDLPVTERPVLLAASFGSTAGGYLEHPVNGSEPAARPGYAIDYKAGGVTVRRYFGLVPEGSVPNGYYQAHAAGLPDDGYRAGRMAYRSLVRQVASDQSPYAGVFLHVPAWYEGTAYAEGQHGRGPGCWDCRFTPGGEGTIQSPGQLWLLRELPR
jgi:hypothetical protein